jgi:hypothetical protein
MVASGTRDDERSRLALGSGDPEIDRRRSRRLGVGALGDGGREGVAAG